MRGPQHLRTAEDAFEISPLFSQLVRLLDERWTGSLLVHDRADRALAALRCEAGVVVAGKIRGGAGTLIEQVSALCVLEDARVAEVDGSDLVGDGPDVATGLVDPLPLIAAAMRGSIAQAAVDRAIDALGPQLLKLSPRADLGRYGFERRELQTLAALEPAPLDLSDLRARSALPGPRLSRLLCTLLATRALTVVPAWKRISSGEIVHAPPVPAPGAAAPSDEPTAVVPLDALAREHAARAARHPARRANSTHLEYLPKPLSRARISRQPGTSERPAVPYLMNHPRSGVEVAHSAPPPPREQRLSDMPSHEASDAHFKWAEQLLHNGNSRGAVFEAQRAMKLSDPNPSQRALYAWLLYQRSGDGTPVQPHVWTHVDQALEQDPDCAAAHYFKGALLARAGHIADAIVHLERALELDPHDAEAARELERCRQLRSRR